MLHPRNQIVFDPANPEHVAWFQRTLATKKLDPQFRFQLEDGFESILGMAMYKMAQAWVEVQSAKVPQSRLREIQRNSERNKTVVHLKPSATNSLVAGHL